VSSQSRPGSRRTRSRESPGENGGEIGEIGQAVLSTLLPARRVRCSARIVKCGTPRHAYRDPAEPRPDIPTAITIRTHPAHHTHQAGPTARRPPPAPGPPPS
jgi:hypothetical protein